LLVMGGFGADATEIDACRWPACSPPARSDPPNPIELHTVAVVERDGCRLRVDALEAIDGTPILGLKIVIW